METRHLRAEAAEDVFLSQPHLPPPPAPPRPTHLVLRVKRAGPPAGLWAVSLVRGSDPGFTTLSQASREDPRIHFKSPEAT